MIKINNSFPSRDSISKLLNYFQSGQLNFAEELAISIINQFPDHQFTWKVLGLILFKANKQSRALIALNKAIELSPRDFEAYNNLGLLLQDLRRWGEAEISCKKAVEYGPQSPEAQFNLAHTYQKLGKLKKAKIHYLRALSLRDNYVNALYNLSIVYEYLDEIPSMIETLKKILREDENNVGLRAKISLAINSLLDFNLESTKNFIFLSSAIQQKKNHEYQNEKIYYEYLYKLINWYKGKSYFNNNENKYQKLFVIGESHSLITHGLNIKIKSEQFICKAHLVKGCMQWHLGNPFKNQYKYKFEKIFNSLPKFSKVLLIFGEIDCRLDGGILKHLEKYQEKNLDELIKSTTKNYINYISQKNLNKNFEIFIQSVPCPNLYEEKLKQDRLDSLIYLIKRFNEELKKHCFAYGHRFIDVHEITNRGDGLSNKKFHIDRYHLTPEGFISAWRLYEETN